VCRDTARHDWGAPQVVPELAIPLAPGVPVGEGADLVHAAVPRLSQQVHLRREDSDSLPHTDVDQSGLAGKLSSLASAWRVQDACECCSCKLGTATVLQPHLAEDGVLGNGTDNGWRSQGLALAVAAHHRCEVKPEAINMILLYPPAV
jgi:hypothetical protein